MSEHLMMERRALLHNALLLVGATAVGTFSPQALAKAAAAPQRFLAKPVMATLRAVADTIIPASDTPGALAAGVPAKFDALLANWATATTRTEIVDVLGAIDAAARAQKGKAFAALSAADRDAVLRPIDAAGLKVVPPKPGATRPHPFAPVTSVADPGWLRIKDLVINLYYYSEIGSTQELVYDHVPGPFQPSIKLTPQSHPWLGTGPF